MLRRSLPAAAPSLALALLLAAGVAHAKPPPEDDGPPPPKPPYVVEEVSIPLGDGVSIAGTYGAAGAKPFGPAVVMIPMEGKTRAVFEPLYACFEEHRVPWLAIDHRAGNGATASTNATVAGDAWAAVRWLVEKKGHDPGNIGLMGAGVAASAAVRCAHEHQKDLAAIVLMTPHFAYPGYDLEADAHGLRGAMDVLILSAAQDMDKPAEKKGPRHLVYLVKFDRDAPKDTPLDERITKRRGIPPRQRAFDDEHATGTAMIRSVPQMPAWLAGWWGRRFGTLPNDVLFDGRVDKVNDFADPGWDAGAVAKGPEGFDARALRWGRRVMVGGEAPRDAVRVFVRIRISRGDASIGQLATIELPSGALQVSRLEQRGGRREPIETQNLALPPDEVVGDKKHPPELLNPCFEIEFRFPEIERPGPYDVRVTYGVKRSDAGAEETGVDTARPETWALVPDSLEGPLPPKPQPPVPAGMSGASASGGGATGK